MPPTTVHFNGSVNLPDADQVMREIATRVPYGVRRVTDGETGDRKNWIFYQLEKFRAMPELEEAGTGSSAYRERPKLRLAPGVDAQAVSWPNLGYADAYRDSYRVYRELRDAAVLPAEVRFQVQYPTPSAAASAFLADVDQDALLPSYERALLADLAGLLAALPHDEVAVQWDVATEFAAVEQMREGAGTVPYDVLTARLTTAVDAVPADVPVGLHLCYGDYGHRHFKEPDSLEPQVRVANAIVENSHRPVSWFSFTVPQYQRDPAYFAPLRELRLDADTELYFSLVPYHPDEQESGTTSEQVRLVDTNLDGRAWGICTECGMGRADQDDVPGLLDQHREILAAHGA